MSINAYLNLTTDYGTGQKALIAVQGVIRTKSVTNSTSLGLECRPVSAVIADTGLSQTNVSFHLRKLREMNLVRGEKNGSFVFYCISDPELLDLLNRFQDWIKRA